jgi:putative two-component system response regulator
MSPTALCTAEIDSILPYPRAPDLDRRLAELCARLREAPLTHASGELFSRASRAFETLADDKANADFVFCLLCISRYSLANGDGPGTVGPASRAAVIAERLGDSLLLAKALKFAGNGHFESGSYVEAIGNLDLALGAARKAPDRSNEIDILSSIGLIHQSAGNYGAAVHTYEIGIELSERAGINPIVRGTILGNLANLKLQVQDYSASTVACQMAIAALPCPSGGVEKMVRALLECYYARALAELRQIPLARERANLAQQFAAAATPLTVMTADLVQGLVDVYDPTTRDIGLSRLQRAMNGCRNDAVSILSDALAIMVRGYEVAGQLEEAAMYLRELAHALRTKRECAALMQHRHHMRCIDPGPANDISLLRVVERQAHAINGKIASRQYREKSIQSLERLAVSTELRNDHTGLHIYRVGRLAALLADALGCDEEFVFDIELAGRLHDIGKIGIPDWVILKRQRLTSAESAIMNEHTTIGAELLARSGLPQIQVAREVARHHHEHWDGTGYPAGLVGEAIPLSARIFAHVDLFDDLTHARPYKPDLPLQEALMKVMQASGSTLDPGITPVFIALIRRLNKQYGDLDEYLGHAARQSVVFQGASAILRALHTSGDPAPGDSSLQQSKTPGQRH